MMSFDLSGPLPSGRTVLEASAGTGKTYSLTGLIVRYVAEAATPLDQLLVVTFTRAAANELRERTRMTLDLAGRVLRGGIIPASHGWMASLLDTSMSPGDPQVVSRPSPVRLWPGPTRRHPRLPGASAPRAVHPTHRYGMTS